LGDGTKRFQVYGRRNEPCPCGSGKKYKPGLRTGPLAVTVDGVAAAFTRQGDTVAITATAVAGVALGWSITLGR
jgi:uncharacterized Zn-binding protein involved in type VI secretion